MRPIRDALELLTAQHEEIDELVIQLHQDPARETFSRLADKLVAHLALEQELFYPVIATTISPEVLGEVLDEHGAIKRVLAELVWVGVEDPSFRARLVELGQLLCGHCGWQEEHLFETVAEAMSPESLASLGTQLLAHHSAFPVAVAA